MEIIEIKKKALLLDPDEVKKLKFIIDYAYHRAYEHPDSPVAFPEHRFFIEYLRKQLTKI